MVRSMVALSTVSNINVYWNHFPCKFNSLYMCIYAHTHKMYLINTKLVFIHIKI